MTHLIAALFFLGLLMLLGMLLQQWVRDNLAEIAAALRGELPPRARVSAVLSPSVPATRLRKQQWHAAF